ncbi:MAG: hypothetical protein WC003_11030 [Terrimicrobiaceae bacterium]|jgi:hypothetical protein
MKFEKDEDRRKREQNRDRKKNKIQDSGAPQLAVSEKGDQAAV